MWMALARLGLTLKRTPARVRASEQDRPDVAAARAGWALAAPAPDPARLVFPDETWATANVVRARGRAPRGERLAAAVPHGHWHTTTFLCGLRADGAASGPTVRPQGRRCGLRADGLVAPFVLDGAITGPAFLAYVEQALAPTLAAGDVVVLDNLASHEVKGVREAVEARGRRRAPLPAALQPRPESGRARLQQAQAPAPSRRRPDRRRPVERHRTAARPLQPRRMRRLLQHCGHPQPGR
jgi:hypothetical protein